MVMSIYKLRHIQCKLYERADFAFLFEAVMHMLRKNRMQIYVFPSKLESELES